MHAAIDRAPVQICDVNPEQPNDLFCNELFGTDVTDLNMSAGNGCVQRLFAVKI